MLLCYLTLLSLSFPLLPLMAHGFLLSVLFSVVLLYYQLHLITSHKLIYYGSCWHNKFSLYLC